MRLFFVWLIETNASVLSPACVIGSEANRTRLPIITSRRQELWLGVQIKAVDWGDHLHEHSGLRLGGDLQTSTQWLLAAYKVLFGYQLELETCCEKIEIQMPKVEIWAAELLRVRQNIFELRRSRLRRFVRKLAQIVNESTGQGITDLSYSIAELLCFLPDDALKHVVEFARAFERLPSVDEIEEWVETSKELEHPYQRHTKLWPNRGVFVCRTCGSRGEHVPILPDTDY
jgi:hypothetical protein